MVRFAPEAEVLGELVIQLFGLDAGADCEAHRAGRAHVGGALDPAAEGLLQDAGDGRNLRSAAGYIEGVERILGMGSQQIFDDLAARLDQRTAALVVDIDRDGDFLPASLNALEI